MMTVDELKGAANELIVRGCFPEDITHSEHAAITQLAGLYSDKSMPETKRIETENDILSRYEKEQRKDEYK